MKLHVSLRLIVWHWHVSRICIRRDRSSSTISPSLPRLPQPLPAARAPHPRVVAHANAPPCGLPLHIPSSAGTVNQATHRAAIRAARVCNEARIGIALATCAFNNTVLYVAAFGQSHYKQSRAGMGSRSVLPTHPTPKDAWATLASSHTQVSIQGTAAKRHPQTSQVVCFLSRTVGRAAFARRPLCTYPSPQPWKTLSPPRRTYAAPF